MAKRLFLLILVIAVFLSTFTSIGILASETLVEADLIQNGDMELLGSSTYYWTGTSASGVTIEQSLVHGGEQSMKMSESDTTVHRSSTQTGIIGCIPGETYTVSAYVYPEDLKTSTDTSTGAETECWLNVAPLDANGAVISGSSANAKKSTTNLTLNTWNLITLNLTAPEGVSTVRVRLWLRNGGTVYWDDITFIGNTTETYKAEIDTTKINDTYLYEQGKLYMQKLITREMNREYLDGAQNILLNPGFEDVSYTSTLKFRASNWAAFSTGQSVGGWENNAFVVKASNSPSDVYSGNYAVKIDSKTLNPDYIHTVYQVIDSGLEPGYEFMLSARIKVKDIMPNHCVYSTILAYNHATDRDAATNLLETKQSPEYILTAGSEWHEIKFTYRLPENTKAIRLNISLKGAGEIIIDNAKFAKAKFSTENLVVLDSYRKFFYTENEYSSVFANVDTANIPIQNGSYVKFTLKDEEDRVVTTENVPAAQKTVWNFRTSHMTQTQKPYTISASYYDASDELLGTTEESLVVYKWDRPRRMDANGNFIDPNTGKIWYPSIGGSIASFEDIEYMSSIGCNTFKQVGTWQSLSVEDYIEQLDWFQEHGLKMCLALYYPVAGHPTTLHKLRAIVSAVKDHPAMYGYMLMDEPSIAANANGQVKTFDHMVYFMTEGYKEIRSIDPNNLVYCNESAGATVEEMRATSACTDVFMIDPYAYAHSVVPGYQIRFMKHAFEATGGNVKQLTYIRAAAMGESDEIYDLGVVTGVAVRHQAYQALWMGAHEFGYTPATSSAGWKIQTSPYVSEIEAFTTSGEQQIMRDHFHGVNTTLVSNVQEDDLWMRSWIAEDGKKYLLLMNMTTEDLDVELDFKNLNSEDVAPDGYTAVPVNGATTVLESNNSTISTTLSDIQVALYELTFPDDAKLDLDTLTYGDKNISPVVSGVLSGSSIEYKIVAYKETADAAAFAQKSNFTYATIDSATGVITTLKPSSETDKVMVIAKITKDGFSDRYVASEITINKKEITAVSVESKGVTARAYNGSKSVDTWTTPPTYTLTGAVAGDDVTLGGTYEFNNSGEGINKPISLSDIVLTGTNAERYVLAESVPRYMNNVGTGTITAYQGFDPDLPVSIEFLSKITDTKYSYSFYTNSDLNYESVVYIAYYDDYDNLLGINTTNLSLVSYDSVILDIELNPLYPTAEKIKLFVWSDTMKPLSNTYLTNK
ncbi:MAG: carbohydrate binding domain-containing protein [Clostridia bacterium]|nr:carbohydrate binding domain-containing protein [Clostridia bacterium]